LPSFTHHKLNCTLAPSFYGHGNLFCLQEHKNTPNLVVMERHTGRLVTGAHAPSAANLISWLTKHPSFEVLRPGQQSGHVSSSSSHRKQKSKLLSTGECAWSCLHIIGQN